MLQGVRTAGRTQVIAAGMTLAVLTGLALTPTLAQAKHLSLRTAAQVIGVGRVAEAHRTRGLYP